MWAIAALLAAACGDDERSTFDAGDAGAPEAGARDAATEDDPDAASAGETDLVATTLDLDLTAGHGVAILSLVPGHQGLASLEVGDLAIESVTMGGAPVPWSAPAGALDVEVGDAAGPVTIEVQYGFSGHAEFEGYVPSAGLTFLFPEHCGNLFPCRSSPRDGSTFRISVRGAPAGQVAIYPAEIPTEAPAYMVAFAHAAFVQVDLGTTGAGTAVHAWHVAGLEADAAAGTAHLVEVFDFYERTLGPYAFGTSVGSVAAAWGEGRGGMEHHPYWHVAERSFGDPSVHAHEAAHGWFGDGVRLRCWEDFVLSEGTATYLATEATAAVDPAGGDAAWLFVETELDEAIAAGRDTVAWPEGCDRIDLPAHPLLSVIPYCKGALFLRDVRDAVGAEALHAALARFYQDRVGTAAGMGDLVTALRSDTGVDPVVFDALVAGWLRGLGRP